MKLVPTCIALTALVSLAMAFSGCATSRGSGPMDTPAALAPSGVSIATGNPAVEGRQTRPAVFSTVPAATNSYDLAASGYQDGASTGLAGDAGIARAAEELAAMRIYFAFNRWNLNPESLQALARAAALLQQYPGLGLRIDGHCDQLGQEEYNFALGERRARAAYNTLIKNGVIASQLEMVTFGKLRPASPGMDPQSRALNRRNEFILLLPRRGAATQ